MKKKIKKIFEENNFEVSQIEETYFYSLKNIDEYYLTCFLNKEELKKNDDDNFEFWDKYVSPLQEKGGVIEKNTSLIIFLKLDKLDELREEELKNKIFQIEEDEYFFRKYVVAYTDQSFQKLNEDGLTEEKLSKKLKNESKFKEFQVDNYSNDEYYLIMQLFVKLPFLSFQSKNDNAFQSLRSLIEDDDEINKKLKEEIIENEVDPGDISFVNEFLSEKDLPKRASEFLEKLNLKKDEG